MSEKTQRTRASVREKMLHRYDDGLEHKHDKNPDSYSRRHWRSHPAKAIEELIDEGSTGAIREFKLRKIRKRLDKGRIH